MCDVIDAVPAASSKITPGTPAFRHGEERGGLGVALVFDILLDNLQSCATDCGDEVRIGPKRGESGLEGRKFLTKNTR